MDMKRIVSMHIFIALLFTSCGMGSGNNAEHALTPLSDHAIDVSSDGNTHDYGVLINGIRWATRNVDAPGTFTQNPEDPGMLFHWNRKRAGISMSRFWNRRTAVGTEWYMKNDPCPDGWRVPTKDELCSLNNAGSEWTTRGRLFGAVPYQVFLPATGWRIKPGSAGWSGSAHGKYWSSTTYASTHAWHLCTTASI